MKHEKTSWKRPTFNSNRIGYLQTNMVLFPSNTASANTFKYYVGTFPVKTDRTCTDHASIMH